MAEEKVYIPEVLEPDEKLPPDLAALRRFATLMDEAIPIPGTGQRFGLDAGISLIPGVGDVISAVLSATIVAGAIRHRVPFFKICRMLVNIGIDVLIGSVPILGDIFDFVFEQNVMNMRLLMTHRNRKLPPRRTRDVAVAVTFVFIVVIGFALLITAAMIALVIWLAEQRRS